MQSQPTVIAELLKAEFNLNTRTKLAQALKSLDTCEIIDSLIQAGQQHNAEKLGYFVFPLLADQIRDDFTLFKELLEGVARPDAGWNFQFVALDMLDKIARRKKGSWLIEYIDNLYLVVVNRTLEAKLRAKAIRLLGRHPSDETRSALNVALESQNPILVEAIGNVLFAWIHKKQTAPTDLLTGLLKFCSEQPTAALSCPGILRALAVHTSSEAEAVLVSLRDKITTPEQRDAMLAAVGSLARPAIVGDLLKDTFANPTDVGLQIVRGLIAHSPARLSEIHRAGYLAEYLTGLQLAPYVISSGDLVRFRELLHSSDTKLANLARQIYFHQVGMTPTFNEIKIFPVQPAPPPTGPQKVSTGWATGLQKADAIYKSLGNGSSSGSSGTDIFGNHWHAGLFTGFLPSVISGCFLLGIVHVSSWYSCVHAFTVGDVFTARQISLVSVMQSLKSKLLSEFGCTATVAFHGARCAAGVSYISRQKIIDTAWALVGKDIEWTFVDQLDYCWWDWDGTIDDIDELRCDGLVEYSYEANGVRVCGGIDGTKWNVAYPDADYAENHNNFHGYGCSEEDYDKGDLCPRIQAGDIADDTSFLVPHDACPVISNLEIYPPSPCCVWLSLKVESEFSRCVYIRILVRKADDDEFYFLKSEDPLGQGEANFGPLEGTWCLKQVNIRRTDNKLGLFWMGKTILTPSVDIDLPGVHCTMLPEIAGPNFQYTSGMYEFLIQCIDEGGNVSDEWSYQIHLTWK